MRNFLLFLFFTSLVNHTKAADTLIISFLYGSKPKAQFQATQPKWFGGIHGGHVGLGTNKDSIYHFLPSNGFHVRKHYKLRYSKFVLSNATDFKQVFGSSTDSLKMLHIFIPISESQKRTIDSLHMSYIDSVPYDYAFVGMRCASASYEVLSHIGITKKIALSKMVARNFYPKKLRKRLVRKAKKRNWLIKREPGTFERIWEKD